MKLLIIVAISMSLMACSFSKEKSKSDNTTQDKLQTRENIDALLMTTFERLAIAIIENDSKAFNLALVKAKRSDLNQLTPGGKSLLELCIETDRLDFFRDLIDAGIAPFMPTKYSEQGLRNTLVPKAEFKTLVINAQKKLAHEASTVCVKNDVARTISFLKESYAGLYVRACGLYDLFEYHFLQPSLFGEAELSLVVEFASEFNSELVMGQALSSAIVAKNMLAVKLIDEKNMVLGKSPTFGKLVQFVANSNMEELLDVYAFVEEENAKLGAGSYFISYMDYFDVFKKIEERRPQPPPPPGTPVVEENNLNQIQAMSLLEGIRLGVKYRISKEDFISADQLAEFETLFEKYGVQSKY